MDRPTFETLELDALLKLLARHVQTPLGRSLALSLQPAVDRSAIDRDLDFTGECERFLESGR